MVIFQLDHAFIWLLVMSRMLIGVGFIGVAIELVIIVHYLNSTLPFRRVALMFAGFISACGVSRLADSCMLLTMGIRPIPVNEMLVWAFDSLSAVMSLAMLAILVPLTWNATGGHWRIRGV